MKTKSHVYFHIHKYLEFKIENTFLILFINLIQTDFDVSII